MSASIAAIFGTDAFPLNGSVPRPPRRSPKRARLTIWHRRAYAELRLNGRRLAIVRYPWRAELWAERIRRAESSWGTARYLARIGLRPTSQTHKWWNQEKAG